MKHILQLLIFSLLFSCSSQEGGEECFSPDLIAHGGGAVDSCIYTNSREAMELAFEKGYHFVEFDLLFTSDSVLVAAHSWSDFNAMTDSAHLGDMVPSFGDFASRKILGRYTPLSAAEINTFFELHDSLFLVTDKVSDPDILQRYFPNLKKRMVVEAFSYQHYINLQNEGYHLVMYSCIASDVYSVLFKNLLFSRLFPGKRIEWMAVHTSAFDIPFFKFINRVRRFNIALFTVDDLDSLPSEQTGRATMIYTNYMLP